MPREAPVYVSYCQILERDYALVKSETTEIKINDVPDGLKDLSLNGVSLIDGVPIIDPMLTSLKFTELMLDFKGTGFPNKSASGLFLAADIDAIGIIKGD